MEGENPLLNGQLTQAEIDRCSKDESTLLVFSDPMACFPAKKKERKYTPIAYRQDRPKAIAWLVKRYPLLSDSKIAKLIATTPKTIQAVRSALRILYPKSCNHTIPCFWVFVPKHSWRLLFVLLNTVQSRFAL